jgi:6-pyruvoyltetrahydropterin/6-carboxytetrahydropterin synthase
MVTCIKRFGPFPFAHRQHKHDGHCALIHGHNFYFEVMFMAANMDENNFVVDFGKLDDVKRELGCHFDHTFVVNYDDPNRGLFTELHNQGLCKLIIVDSGSAEGLAEFAYKLTDKIIRRFTNERVRVYKVTCFEDEKNAATYSEGPL